MFTMYTYALEIYDVGIYINYLPIRRCFMGELKFIINIEVDIYVTVTSHHHIWIVNETKCIRDYGEMNCNTNMKKVRR